MKVIIPSANPDNCRTCIRAVQRQSWAEITVITDGGGPFTFYPDSVPLSHITGKRPFCFARNVNLAIQDSLDHIILLNDDAVLVSGSLFDLMDEALKLRGIVSASVRGVVNNPEQAERRRGLGLRELSTGYLAFVCVAIPRFVIDHAGMGLLDERFTTYGGEDVDYCHSARVNGIPLAVWDGCVVDHGNILPSTFRRNGVQDIEPGLRILRDKWERIRNTPLPL